MWNESMYTGAFSDQFLCVCDRIPVQAVLADDQDHFHQQTCQHSRGCKSAARGLPKPDWTS